MMFHNSKSFGNERKTQFYPKNRDVTWRSSDTLRPRQRETWEQPVIFFFYINFFKLSTYSSAFINERVISPNWIKFTSSAILHVMIHSHTDFISPCNKQTIQSDPSVKHFQALKLKSKQFSDLKTQHLNSSIFKDFIRTNAVQSTYSRSVLWEPLQPRCNVKFNHLKQGSPKKISISSSVRYIELHFLNRRTSVSPQLKLWLKQVICERRNTVRGPVELMRRDTEVLRVRKCSAKRKGSLTEM